jgi:hypothetical protein
MAEGILARVVHVEAVVRVFDQRYLEAGEHEARNHLLDQGGLAATGPAGKAENFHRRQYAQAAPKPWSALLI